jgi:hypothetical protein
MILILANIGSLAVSFPLQPVYHPHTSGSMKCGFQCYSALSTQDVLPLPLTVFEPLTPSPNPVTLLTLSNKYQILLIPQPSTFIVQFNCNA